MPINIDNTVYSDTEAVSLIKKLRKENDELRSNKEEMDEQCKPELSRYDWDIIINDVPYYAYYAVNYFKKGNNGVYICPRNETPNKDNLVPFKAKYPVSWNIIDNTHIYMNEYSAYTVSDYIITRNNKAFTHYYDLIDALRFIRDVGEHPMNLNDIDFDKKVVGRKIWWRDEPAIITRFNWIIGTVSFKPDGIDRFTTPKEFEDDVIEYYEDMDSIHTDIWDKHIGWFREE